MGDGDKIEWLTAENQRLRQELEAQSVHNGSMIREYRPRNAFDATDLEARSLVAKVQEAYPAVRWQIPPNSAFEELQRNYMRQFRAAMIGLSTMVRRAEAVDYGHALSFWIETVEEANKLRDVATSIHPRVFMCAVIASGDISFTRWWQSGEELAIGLRVGGDGKASTAWRKLLNGEIEVPRPVESRPIRETQKIARAALRRGSDLVRVPSRWARSPVGGGRAVSLQAQERPRFRRPVYLSTGRRDCALIW
jgi:hypothetical protein